MKQLWQWIRHEPVMAWQVTAAILSLLGSFGFQLTTEQTAALFAIFQVGAGLAGRQLVSPTADSGKLRSPRRAR